jgi:uncharacterized protein YdeI (YjbR/CyaY-like superfamily)
MTSHAPSAMNPKVDGFLSRAKRWQPELEKLRLICLDCGLIEELKWGKPCYVHQGSNLIILQGFKDFCALLFTAGALLDDPDNVLKLPGENTQAARRMTFTDVTDIKDLEQVIKRYIQNAKAVKESGKKVAFKKPKEFSVPAELQSHFDQMPEVKMAFYALTPGRQRAYLMHFSGAKQAKTRTARIEKCTPQILDGQGLNDVY